MKKLRLKALSLGAKEILSREQLKAVFGGYLAGSGSGGSGHVGVDCESPNTLCYCGNELIGCTDQEYCRHLTCP